MLGEKADLRSTRLFPVRRKEEIRADTKVEKSFNPATCWHVNIACSAEFFIELKCIPTCKRLKKKKTNFRKTPELRQHFCVLVRQNCP